LNPVLDRGSNLDFLAPKRFSKIVLDVSLLDFFCRPQKSIFYVLKIVLDVSLLNAKIGQLKKDSLGVMVKREAEPQPFSYETAVEGSNPAAVDFFRYENILKTVLDRYRPR
jgi:hypothetical protein